MVFQTLYVGRVDHLLLLCLKQPHFDSGLVRSLNFGCTHAFIIQHHRNDCIGIVAIYGLCLGGRREQSWLQHCYCAKKLVKRQLSFFTICRFLPLDRLDRFGCGIDHFEKRQQFN